MYDICRKMKKSIFSQNEKYYILNTLRDRWKIWGEVVFHDHRKIENRKLFQT